MNGNTTQEDFEVVSLCRDVGVRLAEITQSVGLSLDRDCRSICSHGQLS